MTLAEELDAEEAAAQTIVCKVCRWEDQLSEDDARVYKKWLSSNGEKSKLFRACGRINPPVPSAYSTFVRHLRDCSDVSSG